MFPLGQERSEVKASGEDVGPVPSGILSERGNESRETRNPFYSAKRLDVGESMEAVNGKTDQYEPAVCQGASLYCRDADSGYRLS
jgi:hypothetical protein